jgi:hypothetical protein
MVGMPHTNCTGVPSKAEVAALKKNIYKSIIWQQHTKPLIYTAWVDNNVVKMLSNCHFPEKLQDEFQ